MKRILQFVLVSLISAASMAQTVTTWSGSKTTQGNSNNISLASALWAQPHSICIDGNNNFWITDDANHCVKLVQGTTVYNRAGSQFAPGTSGAWGYVNASSSSAKFNAPRGVACDASNNIYVCDYNNNAIRKIDAFTTVGNAQAVSTLCGAPETTGIAASGTADGTGTAARFNGPSGICRDNSGNFYVTDENNNMIRKIVISTGVVTTLCGSASGAAGGLVDGSYAVAKFKYPRGITFSASENALYVCDFGNNRIRKIDLTAGTVTVYLGSASGSRNGFMGQDGNRLTGANSRACEGVVLDYLGNLFFTSSSNAHTVRRIEKSTGLVYTMNGSHQLSGNTDGLGISALFNQPTGMYLTADHTTMLVCDNMNGIIRSIDLRPTADFYASATSIVAGNAVNLVDTSLSMLTSWKWTITPGVLGTDYQYTAGSATSQFPTVKFNTAGTYTIKDSVNNPYGGNAKTRVGYITVANASGQPVADFTVNTQTGTTATTFLFTDLTTSSSGCTFLWAFSPSTIQYLNSKNSGSQNTDVSFLNNGLYSVTLTVTKPTFSPSVKSKPNYITVGPAGINKVTNEFLFNLFPNPNSGNFTLITSQPLAKASGEIIDVQGRVVARVNLEDSQEQNVSLPSLNAGIYFMRIIAADKVATQRLVIE